MEKNKYESNSKIHKENNKPEVKKVEKIVSGSVKQTKKSFLMTFFEKDLRSVGRDVLNDTLVPELKKAIADIVRRVTEAATDGMFYGGSARGSGDRRSTASRVSYGKCYDQRDNTRNYYDRRPEPSNNGYSDLVFSKRKDAEETIDRLNEMVDHYGMASVADLYDLAGVTGASTDNGYGWTDLSSARIETVRDGYALRLPRVMPIK